MQYRGSNKPRHVREDTRLSACRRLSDLRSRYAPYIQDYPSNDISRLKRIEYFVGCFKRLDTVDNYFHAPVSYKHDGPLELVKPHVASAQQLDLLEDETRGGKRKVDGRRVPNGDNSPARANQSICLLYGVLVADSVDYHIDPFSAGFSHQLPMSIRIVRSTGVQTETIRNIDSPLRGV